MALDLEVGDDALELIAGAVKLERCILFLGAGVHAPPPEGSSFDYSAERRPPIGSALSQKLASSCKLEARLPREDPSNLQRVALFYEIARSRRQLVDAVTDAVQTGKRPSPMLRALAQLGFPLVITTNYDQLFEHALVAAGKEPRVAVYTPKLEATTDYRDPTVDSPIVFKIHGDIARPETIVITDEDYIQFVLRMSNKDPYDPVPLTLKYYLTWAASIGSPSRRRTRSRPVSSRGAPGPLRNSGAIRASRRRAVPSVSTSAVSNVTSTITAGAVVRAVSWMVDSGVSAPRKRMRQPCERRMRPKARRLMSCCSPGAQASRARGPEPRPQSLASESSRPRIRLLAKCSWLISTLPCSQPRPTALSVGEDEIAYEGLEPEGGQTVIERGLNGGFVVGLDRAHQACPGLVDQAVGRGGALQRHPRRLRRGQALVQGPPHARDPFGVFFAVEAKATGRAHRAQEPIALLPCTQQLGRDADPPREFPDAMSAAH